MPGHTIYWVKSSITSALALEALSTVDSADYELWHKRYGHVVKDVLDKAKKHTQNFPKDLPVPKKTPICRGCAERKMHSKSFPVSKTRATKPFERIHSDLKSFPVESYHRYKYYMNFYDDYTSHGWIVLLRAKSDAIKALKQFIAMVHTQHNAKIVEWMSDEGGEFKSNEFDDVLRDNGIKILQSVPYTPQQNGRAERFMRTIMDKAESLRLDACFPQSWWEFSVMHALHLHNRTPTRRLAWRTPYELLNGKAPDVSHLRVFGCGAYVFVPEERRVNKLSPKSELMIFIGYQDGMKGYVFMRPSNNSIVKATTALFDETLFPKCPESQRRGFTPVGEIPNGTPPNIPSEDSSDDEDFPSRKSDSYDLPSKGGNSSRDDDNVPPPPAPPQDPPSDHDDHSDPPTPGDENEDNNELPRRSVRARKPMNQSGSLYGNDPSRTPAQLQKEADRQSFWRQVTGDREPPDSSRSRGRTRSRSRGRGSRSRGRGTQNLGPEPSSATPPVIPEESSPEQSDTGTSALPDDDLRQLAQEGGVEFMNFLLSKSIPNHEPLPQHSEVKEWTFRDIARLPASQQKEWKTACKEELEALRK
ncbi:hypothetical protein MPER_12933 [Moniliophthora perniciosa FA553]|nr:hypothetical protein MPER_12933 [Moniliophthora perniciosa FA553]